MKVDGSKIYAPSGDPIFFTDSRFFVCVSFHLTTILRLSGASWEFEKFLHSAHAASLLIMLLPLKSFLISFNLVLLFTIISPDNIDG